MAELSRRVQSLPQELFAQIYNEVFTGPAGKAIINVDESYKPPHQLQVSRASREQFARSYYSDTLFIFKGVDLKDLEWGSNCFVSYGTYGGLVPWLSSLPISHKELLRNVRFVSVIVRTPSTPACIESSHVQRALRDTLQRSLDGTLMRENLMEDWGVVRFELRLVDPDGKGLVIVP